MSHLSKRLQLFRLQAFRWYVLSCFLINVGSGLLYINLTWLALDTFDSVESVAALMLSFWVPVVILGPIGGVIADRFSRKKLIILCIVARVIILFGFYLYWLLGYPIALWQMCLLLGVQGIALGFVLPALMAFVREIVSGQDLLYANSTVDIAYEVGNFVGMGGAGLILAYTSMHSALLINALCFLFAGIAMLFIESAPRQFEKTTQYNWLVNICYDYVYGLQYLIADKKLCLLYSVQLFVMSVFMISPVLLAPFAKNILHAEVGQFGGLEACITVGVIAGGLLSPWLAERFGAVTVVLIELCVLLLAYVMFCLNNELILADALNVFIGIGLSVWALVVTLAQSKTNIDFQGRVQSTFNSISGLMIVILYFLIAVYGSELPVRLLYAVQVFLVLCSIVCLLIYKMFAVKRF